MKLRILIRDFKHERECKERGGYCTGVHYKYLFKEGWGIVAGSLRYKYKFWIRFRIIK